MFPLARRRCHRAFSFSFSLFLSPASRNCRICPFISRSLRRSLVIAPISTQHASVFCNPTFQRVAKRAALKLQRGAPKRTGAGRKTDGWLVAGRNAMKINFRNGSWKAPVAVNAAHRNARALPLPFSFSILFCMRLNVTRAAREKGREREREREREERWRWA